MNFICNKYHHIVEAAKEIWYDNGMINRFEPEDEKVEKLLKWLDRLPENVEVFERELSKLTKEQLFIVCCGEETEAAELHSQELNDFLNRIFDEEYEQ
ncbi:hypothetical protein vBAbaPP1_12 [Acinetobacter phage vB_AbaM_P1]|nr:hypothetical protein vBAbaPP1_12 [Acinetobacter phage vB_AbaM_P1]WAX22671.1 hypothetical protein [Acinetobacter phage vB_AbaP_HB01]